MTQQLQFDLFDHVLGAFAQPRDGKLKTCELYRIAAGRAGVDPKRLEEKVPVGKAGAMVSTGRRSIRWQCQNAKAMGLLERVDGEKGVWQITDRGRQKLRNVKSGVKVLAFSTELGVAILASAEDIIGTIDVPLGAVFTSPEYPLASQRAYGNVPPSEYVEKMCRMFEPVLKKLVAGGTIALSLTNDIFETGSPARSTYLERLIIAFEDRLGLKLLERLVWYNPAKPPGPVRWASMTRQQLNVAWEPILIFTNDPKKVLTDNRRVLEPHTEAHMKLMARGGENRTSSNSDGAYRIRPGSYGNPTEGRIMRNVLTVPGICHSQRAYKKRAIELGLKPHGASFPLELARKVVKFLCDKEHTVLDLFAGSMTTPLACEQEGIPWIAIDRAYDYVRGGAERFTSAKGFKLNLP